jgi:hypothetical protein
MTVNIYPKNKNCIFCGKKVTGFGSYEGLTWDYKDMRTDLKDDIKFRIYENPYHFKCAKKKYYKDL